LGCLGSDLLQSLVGSLDEVGRKRGGAEQRAPAAESVVQLGPELSFLLPYCLLLLLPDQGDLLLLGEPGGRAVGKKGFHHNVKFLQLVGLL